MQALAITAYADGLDIVFKTANNNTGPCTINAEVGSVNVVDPVSSLQAGPPMKSNQAASSWPKTLDESLRWLSKRRLGIRRSAHGPQYVIYAPIGTVCWLRSRSDRG